MNTQISKKIIYGFCIGITISIIATLIISGILCSGEFIYTSPTILNYTQNEYYAALLQFIYVGILGSVLNVSSLILKNNTWNILNQSIYYIIKILCIFLGVSLIPVTVTLRFIIFIFIFFVLWNIEYLYDRYQITELNHMINSDKNSTKTKSKKKYLIIGILIILCSLKFSYNKFISNYGIYFINSTNLTNIYIDDISLENTVNSLNLNKYTSSDKYENKDYNIIFDELMISDQNNIIDKIYGRFDKVQVTINDKKLSSNINNLDSVLGTSYIKSSYDNEQCTYQRIYVDKENKIKASFIYQTLDANTNIKIISVIISRI